MKRPEEPKQRAAVGLWAVLLLAAFAWARAEMGPASSWAGEDPSPQEILRHMSPEPRLPFPEPDLPPSGSMLVRAHGCLECHRLGGEGHPGGVDLYNVGRRLNAEAIERLLQHPREINPEATMPTPPLTRGEALAIAEFLSWLR